MNQFKTKFKAVKDIEPGDIIVSSTMGAKFVTHTFRDVTGDFVFYFGLPNDKGEFNNISESAGSVIRVDRFWGETEFVVITGMVFATPPDDVELLKAQLAARDAALDAVTSYLEDRTEYLADGLREVLAKHGIHTK